MHKFLDPPLNGLDILVEYLQSTLNFMKESEKYSANGGTDSSGLTYDSNAYTTLSSQVAMTNTTMNGNHQGSYTNGTLQTNHVQSVPGSKSKTRLLKRQTSSLINPNLNVEVLNTISTLSRAPSSSLSQLASLERRHSRLQKDTRKRMNRLRIGEAADDVHECVRCLRAIMNHQYGFHMIIGHKEAINSIALSLKHKEYRTKSLVLELLAAVCLVDGGHSIVLRAFDHFKHVYDETVRFETLMNFFRRDSNEHDFNIDFMVACMQFINIVVHSTQNMNFRVHLQYEFTHLGLDDYLENKLKFNESDRLQVGILFLFW